MGVSKLKDNYVLIENGCIRHNGVARLTFRVVKDVFGFPPKIIVRRGYNYNKKKLYLLEFKANGEALKILGIKKGIPDESIIDDEFARANLRGVFLISGSINVSKTLIYHLEFNFNNEDYALFISNLLNEYNLNSKVLHRDNKYMVYVKEAEKIGDFLSMIGTMKAVLYYEDIRIYRDHKNMTNRLNNC